MRSGIFIVSELTGPVAERVHAIQRRYDPKLARFAPPHVTLIGSSGAGPVAAGTTREELRERLVPVAAATEPFELHFERPIRYMQTDFVVLPLDPHGPMRALHERILTSGLRFAQARFTFSPHCTLSFYRTLTPQRERELLALRVDEPVRIERIQCYRTLDTVRSVRELELTLGAEPGGAAPSAPAAAS